METYTLGETLRLELKLRDKSGIGYTAALFNRCSTGTQPVNGIILLIGDGEGRTDATVELTIQIKKETIPGEYRCEYIQVQDALGNHIRHYPDIRFRIEGVPGDHEGPELLDWRFKTE
ncbi:MAG TPA: hypothetical protein VK619_12565 [Pyrinomonadaceae bacterium]|nr:hypothetical protein [Pyrinomonadaceae bacterium]